MEDLLLEVKNEVIEALNLEDMTPEDLGDDDPLFGAGGCSWRRNTASNCRIPKTARRCLSLSE